MLRPLTCALLLALPVTLLADDGQGDPSFDGDGVRIVDWAGLESVASAVVGAVDGSLYVGGRALGGAGTFDGGVAKLTPAGELDTGWGSSGLRRVPFDAAENAEDRVSDLFELAGGSLLVSGFSLADDVLLLENPAIAKLTPGGALDPAFGNGGVEDFALPWPSEEYYWVGAVHQLDGKALYFGACLDCPDNPTAVRPMLLRISTSGVPDSGFSGTGWEVPTAGAWSAIRPLAVAFDALGRILVLGHTGSSYSVTRLTGGGTLDTSFGGGDGNAPFALPSGHSSPYRFAVDPEGGEIYVAMGFGSGVNAGWSGVLRLTNSGALDATYAGDGLAELIFDAGVFVTSLALQSDGRLAGAGRIESTAPGGDLDYFLFRLLPDGSLDNDFHANGVRRVEFGETPDGADTALATTLSGGRLVAVGSVVADGIENFGVARATSALIFNDGFERSSASAWLGN